MSRVKYTYTPAFADRANKRAKAQRRKGAMATVLASDMPYIPEETMPVIWADQDATDRQTQLRVAITDYVKQATTRFITGDMSLDTEWDSSVQALDGMNLTDYIKYYEDGYAAAKTK